MSGLGLSVFNIDNGFLEAIVRGYHNALLTQVDYQNLMQCEKLEGASPPQTTRRGDRRSQLTARLVRDVLARADMKLHLASTTYGNFLQNEPSPLTTSAIQARAQERLVAEFMHIRAQSLEPLHTFMDYITIQYQIDNVAFLILGAQANRSTKELLSKCHPLGMFPSIGTSTVVSSAADLYTIVLAETELGKYFLASELKRGDLDEQNIEIIRSALFKAYLEDFHAFCASLGGTTAEVMCELLELEADRRAISITINSFDTELTRDQRSKLYPNIGKLYPAGTRALVAAGDMESVVAAVAGIYPYDKMLADVAVNPDKSLEDLFMHEEMRLHRESFQRQFSLGVFFSILRMKEQEIRNMVWIGEAILQGQRERASSVIYPL